MKILLLGHTGFVGKTLYKKFKDLNLKNKIIVINRTTNLNANHKSLISDFSQKSILELDLNNIDTVINCIGEIYEESYMENVNFNIVKYFIQNISKL